MEATIKDLLGSYDPKVMLTAILTQLPKEDVDALVLRAAKALGHRFEDEKLSLDRFWEIVEGINWGKDHDKMDLGKMKRHLMTTFPKAEVLGLQERHSEMRGLLAQTLRSWEKETGEEIDAFGDSWDDLVDHIVGCGKEEFDATVKDPSRAARRYDDHEYQESFTYCLPWKEDYEKLEIGYYKDWAKRVHDQWKKEIVDCVAKDTVLEWLLQVAEAAGQDELVFAFSSYDEDKFLPLTNSLRKKGKYLELGCRVGPNEWAVLNLISDARKYFLPLP